MDPATILFVAGVFVLVVLVLAVRRFRFLRRQTVASSLLDAPAVIVSELLTDVKVGELMHDAIPMDPLSTLSTQMSTIAGPAIQIAINGTPVAAQRGRFLVEFSTEGTSAFRSGGLSLLRRLDNRYQPTLVTATSKLKENATLVARGGQMAASAAAVANVVVLLAVQAQLVSMERTLERMENKLDDLRQFLDDVQISKVKGRLRKLHAVREEMSVGPWMASDEQRWLLGLEEADVEFLQVEELAKRQCDDANGKMSRAPLGVVLFGRNGQSLLRDFSNEGRRYQLFYSVRSLTIVGRLAVAHLKSALHKTPGIAQIQHDIDALAESASAHQEVLKQRALNVRTIFRSRAYDESKQRDVVEAAAVFRARSDGAVGGLRREVERLAPGAKRSARAIVEVADDGSVRPVALLSDESQ